MRDIFFRRMVVLGGVFVLFILVIVYRLFSLQVIEYGRLVAESNHQEAYSADTHLERGSIFFTTKDGDYVSAATLASGYTVALAPAKVTSEDEVLAALASVDIHMGRDELSSRLVNKQSQFVVVAEKVSSTAGKELLAKKVPGLVVTASTWRTYPARERAAQVVGFVSYNGNEKEGRLGLELQYNDVLKRSEHALTKNFFADLFSDAEKVVVEGSQSEGDIVTSIEPTVQAELERVMQATHTLWSTKETMGIIMNANTGEIVALAHAPSFDLNAFNTVEDISVFKNPFIESVYEMGSIVKVLTVAMGYDTGEISDSATYNDTGTRTLDKKTFSNFDGKPRGVVSVKEILRQSLNIGAAYVALKVGPSKMREYFLDKYRLDEETGVDLPGEVHGIVTNLKNNRSIEFATASFGQGIATTPLATLRALTAVANGGYLVIPHVVTSIEYPGGIRKSLSYEDQRTQILSTETSLAVSRILVSIVDEKLKNGELKQEHYTVGAKTGTAQIPKPTGGYYKDRYLHTFFGFVPAYEPKYVIMLMNREPERAQYSSETLSDPFMSLVKYLINYYAIAPDR